MVEGHSLTDGYTFLSAYRPAFQRKVQESLAAVGVEVSVGGDFVAAQAVVCFGSGLPSKDVRRMSLFRQKNVIAVSDGDGFRNN